MMVHGGLHQEGILVLPLFSVRIPEGRRQKQRANGTRDISKNEGDEGEKDWGGVEREKEREREDGLQKGRVRMNEEKKEVGR
jgi:hypothetical protein